jgi:hypothetical protein
MVKSAAMAMAMAMCVPLPVSVQTRAWDARSITQIGSEKYQVRLPHEAAVALGKVWRTALWMGQRAGSVVDRTHGSEASDQRGCIHR